MAKNSSLERRGAVYYWRRRLPRHISSHVGQSHFRLCLRTKEHTDARFLATRLDATAAEIFMSPSSSLSIDDLKIIFASAFKEHRAKLEMLTEIDRQDGRHDPAATHLHNRALGFAYRHLSRFGHQSEFGPSSRALLASEGASQEDLDAAGVELERLREQGLASGSIKRIRALLENNRYEANAINITAARSVYLRALGEALLGASRGNGVDALPYDELVGHLEPHSPKTSVAATTVAADGNKPEHQTAILSSSQSHQSAAPHPTAEPALIIEIGEKLVAQKTKDKQWDNKSAGQAQSIYRLFARFMRETVGTEDLCLIEQKHVGAFNEFLLVIKKSYGKSRKDATVPIADLRREGAALPLEKRGIEIPTRNRHYTNLGLLFKYAKGLGHKLDPDLDVGAFRARDTRTDREVRAKPTAREIAPLFQSPVFLGCRNWQHPDQPGTEVFHRGLYFGLLLAVYNGARREEFCGLLVSDVIRDNGEIPYIHITFNEQRRIKNSQSIRNLALHPELIRLGFLDYVQAIEALGYTRLFPDLYSPSTRSPMGDRFYDEVHPILSGVGVTPHQFRHYFNDALKKARITEEERADLLGHTRGTETADRYCDPIELTVQLEIMAKLPVLSAHLQRQPIRLLPWVEKMEIAPWSRAAKLKAKTRRQTKSA
jgi:integrase|tara:strand:- start:21117 stop:23090 length:1974 start_codon:yes stop_codon:yes gene_type:complete